jgi:hypothetical protein
MVTRVKKVFVRLEIESKGYNRKVNETTGDFMRLKLKKNFKA